MKIYPNVAKVENAAAPIEHRIYRFRIPGISFEVDTVPYYTKFSLPPPGGIGRPLNRIPGFRGRKNNNPCHPRNPCQKHMLLLL